MDYDLPEATVIVDEELSLPEGSTALVLAVGAAVGAAVVGWCVGKVFAKIDRGWEIIITFFSITQQ